MVFILFAIIVAISAIVDILVYAILGILLALLCVITYVIHLGLLAAIPLVVLVLEIIYYIKEVKLATNQHLWLEVGIIDLANMTENSTLLDLQRRVQALENGAALAYLDDETTVFSATTASKQPKEHFDFFF